MSAVIKLLCVPLLPIIPSTGSTALHHDGRANVTASAKENSEHLLNDVELKGLLTNSYLQYKDTPRGRVEEFHSDGSYVFHSDRVDVTGRFQISKNMVCVKYDTNNGDRCRRIFRSTAGRISIADLGSDDLTPISVISEATGESADHGTGWTVALK